MQFLYKKNFALVFLLFIETFYGVIPLSTYQILTAAILCSLWGAFQYVSITRQKLWWIKIPYYLIICLFLNFIACSINRGQTVLQSFSNSETLGYFFFLLFAYFFKSKLSLGDCEDIIKKLFSIFIIVYLLKYFVFFDSAFIDPAYLEPWEHRVRLHGQMIGFISFFYFLNRLLIGSKNKHVNIVFFVLSFIFILTLGFRSTLLSVFIASVFMARKLKLNMSIYIRALIGFILLVLIIANTEYGRNVISNMTERMLMDKSDGGNYLRVVELDYFMNSHFISASDYFFGSGNPVLHSAYGKMIDDLSVYNSIGELAYSPAQWRDWGIIGFSWIFGIPTALVLYVYIIFMCLAKTDKRYVFIASTYFVYLLNSITTMEMYRHGAFAFHALLLYMLYKNRKECYLIKKQ